MYLVSKLSLAVLTYTVSLLVAPLDMQAEEPPSTPPAAPPKQNATFVQAPDPSTISVPPALSLRPTSVPEGAMDALPSFPPPAAVPADSDLPDFHMKRRENVSVIPDGPNPTEDAAVSLNRRYRFQLARSRVLNEPAVQEALQAAQKARTDREVRAALTRHYSLLFSRMRSLDSGLEPLIAEREKAALEPLREKFQRPAGTAHSAASVSAR